MVHVMCNAHFDYPMQFNIIILLFLCLSQINSYDARSVFLTKIHLINLSGYGPTPVNIKF